MKVFRSFYAKLSLIFLLLILVLGAGSLFIAFKSSAHLFDEVEQVIHREYAGSIASEIQPLIQDGFSKEAIQDTIHYMMILNPMVEIYIVDEKGIIRAFFTQTEETLLRNTISLEPLEVFIGTNGWKPVLGDDPRTTDLSKPFSAAHLTMGEKTGYVYVILRGQSFDRLISMISSSYYLRSGVMTFFIAMITTILAGFSLFFYQTRRLRRLSLAVKAFEEGHYDYRIQVKGSDEITDLGRAFNTMADSIQKGIEQLHVAEQQRSDLIANISHDLRSPITSIRGNLETILLKGLKISDSEAQKFLTVSIKSVSSLQKQLEELFDLAKLESGQATVNKEAFILAELIQDVALKLTPLADKAKINIKVINPKEAFIINADIGMIERVLSNILENAIAHTPPNGKIEINCSKADTNVTIQIADSGTGIEDTDLPHLFERFYRADKSRSPKIPGTGLGLAIVKEIITLHKGQIKAESPLEGGALFTIELPQ
jgi:signal transduction histidine kinase